MLLDVKKVITLWK